eukprot:1321327-Amorphochlora_amoeboformis.AAC.3
MTYHPACLWVLMLGLLIPYGFAGKIGSDIEKAMNEAKDKVFNQTFPLPEFHTKFVPKTCTTPGCAGQTF